MGKKTKLYFASDIHGSQKCFFKFLNAGKFYGVDVLIMGGDITGKAILFLNKVQDGFACRYMGNDYMLHAGSELEEFLKLVRSNGYYPYAAEDREIDVLKSDENAMNNLFLKLMCDTVSNWMEIAEARLKGTGIRCYVISGNDDPMIIKDIIKQSRFVVDPEDEVIDLDDCHQMASIGWSNPTPWNSPRECSEEELAKKIENMMRRVQSPDKSILCSHVPPYDTGLDEAPQLSGSMQVKSFMGQVQFAPAGSTAVLEAIKKYKYLMSLHGHIHEVHATKRIGQTISVNPGSDYGEGVLHGVLAVLENGKVLSYQLVTG